jgi:predicted DNA binding CopG/RHH family protein
MPQPEKIKIFQRRFIAMARPNKKEEDKKLHRITVRFDGPEYSKIRSKANTVGITVSKFMREKAMRGYVRVPKHTKVDTAAINQISKMGGLLKKVHVESSGAYSERTGAILDEILIFMRNMNREYEDDREAHT